MKPNKEAALVLFCPKCAEAMNVPDEIRTLAEAMAAQIIFEVSLGKIDPHTLKRAGEKLAKPDPHLVRTQNRIPPIADDGR